MNIRRLWIPTVAILLTTVFVVGISKYRAEVLNKRNLTNEADFEQNSASSSAISEISSASATGPNLPMNPNSPNQTSQSYSNGIHSAYGKFQTGNYAAAILLLREFIIKNPNDELAKKNLATSCFALALQRIKEQHLPEAGNLLEEATALGHPQAAAALARLRIRTGEVSEATTVLESIFWKNKDLNAAFALVDIALSHDDLQLAQAYLNRAEGLIEKLNPEDSAAKNTLAERRSRYQARTAFLQNEIVVEQANIQVAFLAREKRPTAQAVLSAMISAQEKLSQNFGLLPENTLFRALIVPSANFRESTGAPPWAQAIFDGIIRLSVANGNSTSRENARTAATARHEMVHAHLSALCGDTIPSWLGEGLAQQFEGRPLAQSIASLRTKLGIKLPKELPSDPWFEKEFYMAPPELIDELYARAQLLVEAVQRTHGTLVWNTIFDKACIHKEPLAVILNNEVGKPMALEIWENEFPEISAIFSQRK